MQVYLVTGGEHHDADTFTFTASTELLVAGASSWRQAGPLPAPMYGHRAVTVDNQVFCTGEKDRIM